MKVISCLMEEIGKRIEGIMGWKRTCQRFTCEMQQCREPATCEPAMRMWVKWILGKRLLRGHQAHICSDFGAATKSRAGSPSSLLSSFSKQFSFLYNFVQFTMKRHKNLEIPAALFQTQINACNRDKCHTF